MYILDAMSNLQGLAGLVMASVFCASLRSVKVGNCCSGVSDGVSGGSGGSDGVSGGSNGGGGCGRDGNGNVITYY